MKTLLHLVTASIALLAFVAILSRLLTAKEVPNTIKSGSNALSNLFNGAFFS